jgi:hypothetical protein
MLSARRPPRRGRALLVLLLAAAAGVALTRVRGQVGTAPGIAPGAATLVVTAQWAVWLLSSYAVAVAGCLAAITALGRPGSARVLLWLAPAAGRPALAAALGIVLTAGPAVASPSPSPAAPAPPDTTTADPFDWAAPADALAGIGTGMASKSPRQQVAGRAPPRPPTVSPPQRPARRPVARTVRVRPGDCLWSLAARDLAARRSGPRPADIAVAWRHWYAANRAVIGPDPALLHPGEVLQVPLLDPPFHPSTRITRRPS